MAANTSNSPSLLSGRGQYCTGCLLAASQSGIRCLPGASGGGLPSFSGEIHHVPRSRISTFFFCAASCDAATDPPNRLPMTTASKSICSPSPALRLASQTLGTGRVAGLASVSQVLFLVRGLRGSPDTPAGEVCPAAEAQAPLQVTWISGLLARQGCRPGHVRGPAWARGAVAWAQLRVACGRNQSGQSHRASDHEKAALAAGGGHRARHSRSGLATVLQLLAAGITVANGSRWRRFGAGLTALLAIRPMATAAATVRP